MVVILVMIDPAFNLSKGQVNTRSRNPSFLLSPYDGMLLCRGSQQDTPNAEKSNKLIGAGLSVWFRGLLSSRFRFTIE